MSAFIILGDLDRDDPLRNAPLSIIKAQTRLKSGGEWKNIATHWGIARNTYNELGPVWTDLSIFRIATVDEKAADGRPGIENGNG